MLNHITIMGRLVRDPELRTTPNGTAVTTFTLAVDRDYSGKDGAEKEADFVDVVCWRHTAEFAAKYFAKGRLAVVDGRLQIRPYTDKDGNKRKAAEVIAEHTYFADSKKDSSGADSSGNAYGGSYASQPANDFVEIASDGDIPF